MQVLKVVPENQQWTGESSIPAVGTTVNVNHSGWGAVKVRGYLVEDGFLGIVATPLQPPAWWVEQKKRQGLRQRNAVFFGLEVDPSPAMVG